MQEHAAKLLGHAAADLPSLSHRRGVVTLARMHRLVHGNAPAPVVAFCPPRAPPPARISRHRAAPFLLPPVRKLLTPAYWLRSFVPLATEAWNGLSPDLQTEPDVINFKNRLNLTSLPLCLSNLGNVE